MNIDAEKKLPTKIGRVVVESNKWSYRVRFFTPTGKRIARSISGGFTDVAFNEAIRRATLINHDLTLNTYDETLSRYGFSKSPNLEIVETPKPVTILNLKEVWENYKSYKKDTVRHSTQKASWRTTNNLLNRLPDKLLNLDNSEDVVNYWLTVCKLSPTTIKRVGEDLISAFNLAIKQGKLDKIPDYGFPTCNPSNTGNNRSLEAFSVDEINAIIEAFKNDCYTPKCSSVKHSHYANFVEFLFLTGCRPGDACGLTWDKITEKFNRLVVVFNESYVYGEQGLTKNGQERLFPVNERLKTLLDNQRLISGNHPENVVFPSPTGKKISIQHFTKRIWKIVVNGLVEDGKVSQYLPTYNCRHSTATFLHSQGVPLARIANLLETSIEMLSDHYLMGTQLDDIPSF